MYNQKEAKVTNEKLVNIYLPFKEALTALLATKSPKEKPKEQERRELKKPSD